MSSKFPYMIQDSKSLLCWTALNPTQPGSTFTLSTCVQSVPPPDNQRFVDLAKYWSGGPPPPPGTPNPVLPILDSSANGAQWAPSSLCLGLSSTGNLVTVSCCDGATSGALGWSNSGSNVLNGICLGPNANGLIAMQSSCTKTPTARFYKPWTFPFNVATTTTSGTTSTKMATTTTKMTTTTAAKPICMWYRRC
jgi:hypothetical protein